MDRLTTSVRLISERICDLLAPSGEIVEADSDFSVSSTHGTSRIDVRVFNSSVYDGYAGIALFLSDAGFVLKDQKLLEIAERLAEYAIRAEARSRSDYSTAFSGSVGLAYAIGRIVDRHPASAIADSLLRILDRLEAASASTPSGWDYVGGISSAVPVLIWLAKRFSRPVLAERALDLGIDLAKRANLVSMGLAWPRSVHQMQSQVGLAHGGSGPAIAFASLESTLPGFRRFALGSIQYEDQQFSKLVRNWPDHRNFTANQHAMVFRSPSLRLHLPVPTSMMSWCYGAPGIALSRAIVGSVIMNTAVARAYDRAERITNDWLARNIDAPNHCLCHGWVGNWACLYNASFTDVRPDGDKVREQLIDHLLMFRPLRDQSWLTSERNGLPERYGLLTGLGNL